MDYSQAFAYVQALAGDPATTTLDFRAIHDTDKAVAAQTFRGTLPDLWDAMTRYNEAGYGIFAVTAALDGVGRKLENVSHVRAHYIDLDEYDAVQQYHLAAAAQPAPGFAVQTSANKFHVYWPVQPYAGNERFSIVQRKLRQVFNGDPSIIDPTRVMRLPGTYHRKGEPILVTCHALAGYGQRCTVEQLEAALASVNVIEGGFGERHPLGDENLAAPSAPWLQRALDLVDPNDLDRGEWIAHMCAFKQAGWTLLPPEQLWEMFAKWCERYAENDAGENWKQWQSINSTELGWKSLVNRVPSLKGLVTFGERAAAPVAVAAPVGQVTPPMPEPAPMDCSGEYLTHLEQQEYFKGCFAIIGKGSILTPEGRFLKSSEFNMRYGGKKFLIDSQGKCTDEAWKAVTRSTLWTAPKVDHIRFLPEHPFGHIIEDALGRKGVNTFIPIKFKRKAGDPTPWLDHFAKIIPDEGDRKTLLAWFAHTIKFPGEKIKWAPMIQSVEGVGKGFIQETLERIIGDMYVYSPKAEELTGSGSTFNGWMRNKLLIIVNEIKVDEQRALVEILKPMITDRRLEVQSKGVDQEMEDSATNWLFFSNFKNAIPVNKNGRRYAVFFSALQNRDDLTEAGFNDAHFDRMFRWLRNGGSEIMADYFLNHPVELGGCGGTAPDTSSMSEAINLTRSPLERVICDGIADNMAGFKGGWVSVTAVLQRCKLTGAVRNPSPAAVTSVLETMGYVHCGRSPRPYFNEDKESRSTLYFKGTVMSVDYYAMMQGYEVAAAP